MSNYLGTKEEEIKIDELVAIWCKGKKETSIEQIKLIADWCKGKGYNAIQTKQELIDSLTPLLGTFNFAVPIGNYNIVMRDYEGIMTFNWGS